MNIKYDIVKTVDGANTQITAKAIWPFLAGAFGGMLSGCSIYGSGVGATL